MNVYLAGTAVKLTIALQDSNGNPIKGASVSYRVLDQSDKEILALTVLDTFVADASEAVVTIPASLNTVATIDPAAITANDIDAYFVRESRMVELQVVDGDGNTKLFTESYALEPSETLIAGLNSFLSYPQSQLVALDIPGLDGWAAATDKDRMAALIEARLHICQLRFAIINSNVNWGQDNLNYVPEGSYPTPYAGMFMFNGNLALITPSNFLHLPARFKAALWRAQVAEADSILAGDPVDARRREGLILETIGESKQMFRSGKPLELPVSKKALRYLSAFVSFSQRIGRG